MRLECEKLEECEATPELIRELVRNGAKRGEFMIMMRVRPRGARGAPAGGPGVQSVLGRVRAHGGDEEVVQGG